MPILLGFTDNEFRTRSDLVHAAKALVQPLNAYRSSVGARVKIRPSTLAAFDDVAAQLEGFARPLWAIYATTEGSIGQNDQGADWIRGIQAGVDPTHFEYWGDLGSFDQRMVEMESIAFTLLARPEYVLASLDEVSIRNLRAWLMQINHHNMPWNNWRWFRIFVNTALIKTLGVSRSELQPRIESDFAILDQFYLENGWSSDGLWGDERKQADYYSGSFAIQFAQLLYVYFEKEDQERVRRYRLQASEFATNYWRYFDINGAAIPFGRSLTYRFAFAAFWSALALNDIKLPAPMDRLGTVKGMLMRHLRWWAKQPNISNADGVLNIGFTYPNMYLSEDYNSPQSVYWCLKSFVVLGLPEDHHFWSCEELPHPMKACPTQLDIVHVNWPPRQILCNAFEHHLLLSSGQMTTKQFKAREAKYGKFAYSSTFAFSVPTGPFLHQMAPDSTLSISVDGGETWKVRWKPENVRIETITFKMGPDAQKTAPALASVWKPFKNYSLEIETIIIPAMEQFPGWHVRIHEIRGLSSLKGASGCENFQLVDASFAISALMDSGHHIPEVIGSASENPLEACWNDDLSILAKSRQGASGVTMMNPTETGYCVNPDGICQYNVSSKAFLIKADPNTNLMSPRTFIPSMKHDIDLISTKASTKLNGDMEHFVLVSGIFGVSGESFNHKEVLNMWNRRPRAEFKAGTAIVL